MNTADMIVLGILLILVGGAVFALARRKKKGPCSGCSGCSSCSNCDSCDRQTKEKK